MINYYCFCKLRCERESVIKTEIPLDLHAGVCELWSFIIKMKQLISRSICYKGIIGLHSMTFDEMSIRGGKKFGYKTGGRFRLQLYSIK